MTVLPGMAMMRSRKSKQITATSAPNFCLPSARGRVCLSDYSGRRPVVLYFMSRFASSLAWRGAIALGGLIGSLQPREVEVLVIGRGGYLRPATRLAAELGLPFQFLSDREGEVSRLYGLEETLNGSPPAVTLLVDKGNIVRYSYVGAPSAGIVDTGGLMKAIERLEFYRPAAPSFDLCRPF
jgi:peroxiredoxin